MAEESDWTSATGGAELAKGDLAAPLDICELLKATSGSTCCPH